MMPLADTHLDGGGWHLAGIFNITAEKEAFNPFLPATTDKPKAHHLVVVGCVCDAVSKESWNCIWLHALYTCSMAVENGTHAA